MNDREEDVFNVIRCDKCGMEIRFFRGSLRVGRWLYCSDCVAIYDVPRLAELRRKKEVKK